MIDKIFLIARERDNLLDRNRYGLLNIDKDNWLSDARLLAYKRDLLRNYMAGQKLRSFKVV